MGLDSAQFQSGIAAVSKNMDRMSKDMSRLGSQMSRVFGGMGSAAMTFSGALAGAAAGAVGSILSVARALAKAKEAMAEFAKMAEISARLGVPAEKLQELRFAAEQSGMAINNFDVALRRFIRRSSEAARGTGAAKDAFKELGINLRDSSGQLKDSDKLLREVADALQNVRDPADKLRLAFKLFDTDGAAMVNVLAKGSQGLDDFAQKARNLGIIVEEHMIKRAAELATEFDTATRVMDMQFKQALVNLAPILVGVAERASRLAGDIRGVVDAMLDLENKSTISLDGRMRSLGLERIDVENRVLELRREQANMSDNARDLGFSLQGSPRPMSNRMAQLGDRSRDRSFLRDRGLVRQSPKIRSMAAGQL